MNSQWWNHNYVVEMMWYIGWDSGFLGLYNVLVVYVGILLESKYIQFVDIIMFQKDLKHRKKIVKEKFKWHSCLPLIAITNYQLTDLSYWGCNVVVYEVIVVYTLLFMTHLDAFQVASFPFDDHNCPPIQLIKSFCQSAYSWLKEDIENVVVVHCKAGMARTGLMICSLLLFLKVR